MSPFCPSSDGVGCSRPRLPRGGCRVSPHNASLSRCTVATLLFMLGALPLPAQGLHSEGGGEPIVESAEAMSVTSTIQCWCGGCTNQTLHDCTCGLAASERQKVATALAKGQTPAALIAAYVAEHGPQVRIVPEKRGLNLIGWAIPFAASLAALAALLMTLLAWRRRDISIHGDGVAATTGSPADRAYRERLDKELSEFDA